MIRISLIDNHPLFRLGLKAAISNNKDIELVGEYGSLENFLEEWRSNPVGTDIIVTELSFKDGDGLNLIRTVKRLNKNVKVIALTTHNEQFYILSAIESGVEGYLHKNIGQEEFIKAIRNIMSGELYYSNFVSQVLMKNIHDKGKRSNQPFLTSREKEVVNYLVKGLSTREIASKLNVSPRTIDSHRYNILNKFKLQNTTQLIRKILEQKITF